MNSFISLRSYALVAESVQFTLTEIQVHYIIKWGTTE